jgi:hypothetical protein
LHPEYKKKDKISRENKENQQQARLKAKRPQRNARVITNVVRAI